MMDNRLAQPFGQPAAMRGAGGGEGVPNLDECSLHSAYYRRKPITSARMA